MKDIESSRLEYTKRRMLLRLTAALIASVGIVVMIGWHLHMPPIVQLHPSFVPMQYNTALAFVLIGGSQFMLLFSYRTLAATFAVGAALIGLLTLIEYASGTSLGIDQWLMDHTITTKWSHPGRMAPNSALCFLLSGCSILVNMLALRNSYRYCVVMAALVAALSAVASSGYVLGLPTAYGWGRLTQMALHTGITFFVSACVTIAWCWISTRQRASNWLPVLACVFVFAISAVAWQSLIAQNYRSTRVEADGFRLTLEHRMDVMIESLERMAKREANKNEPGDALWQKDAAQYRTHFPSLVELKLVDQHGVVLAKNPGTTAGVVSVDSQHTSHDPSNLVSIDFLSDHRAMVTIRQEDDSKSQLIAVCDIARFIDSVADLKKSFDVTVRNPGDNVDDAFVGAIQIAGQPLALNFRSSRTNYSRNLAAHLMLVFGIAAGLLLAWLMRSRLQIGLANSMLAQQNAKLATTNAELAQFAYAASHDIQAPIRQLKTLLSILKEDNLQQLDEAGKRTLVYSVQSANRISLLTQSILDFARVTEVKAVFEPVDVNQLVTEIQHDLKQDLEKISGTLIFHELPTILASPTPLRHLFQNLITNAIKFSKPVGEQFPSTEVQVLSNDDDVNWIFSVVDNGIGIESEHHELIFNAFSRLHTHSRYSGTGLGLSLCRRAIMLHGGQIWLESEFGVGTTFHFTIPKEPRQHDETYPTSDVN